MRKGAVSVRSYRRNKPDAGEITIHHFMKTYSGTKGHIARISLAGLTILLASFCSRAHALYWSPPQAIAGRTRSGVSIAVDRQGNWHVVCDTFSSIKYLSSTGTDDIIAEVNDSQGSVMAPAIDIDSNGGLHIIYRLYNRITGSYSVMYTRTVRGPAIIYVDVDATGNNNGSRWADAFNDLQDALAFALTGDEIRVAQGIYKPGVYYPPPPPPPPPMGTSNEQATIAGSDRVATFQLKNGVTVKGGYAGAGAQDPNACDIQLYETILSGDLAGNDREVNNLQDLLNDPCRAENSYHVVTGSGTDETAVLDGFTITCGSCEYSSLLESFNQDNVILIPPPIYGPENWGGGIYNSRGSPTVSSCTFTRNTAYSGGAMYNHYDSNPTLTNCTFSENIAAYGGGMFNGDNSPTLINCTLTSNEATASGGGMFNNGTSPTIVECTFTENSAGGSGGAMCNTYGTVKLTKCTFRGNYANFIGGGIYSDYTNATLVNCTLDGNNSGGGGGGMYNAYSSPILTNCTFNENSAKGSGGGMYNDWLSMATLANCTFTNNSAGFYGGGMYNRYSSSPMVLNCMFSGNSASNGGAMGNLFSNAELVNCTFTGNVASESGGGMYNYRSNSTLKNCTLSGNSAGFYGGGMYNVGSDATLSNCILWGDTATQGGEIYLVFGTDHTKDEYPSTINVNYSDVDGGAAGVYVGTDCTLNWGDGNIDADPCFISSGYWDVNSVWVDGDYHLLSYSACIDAGDPNYIAEPNETDLDGKPRVISGRIDMGAYEFFNTRPFADAGPEKVVECACNTNEGTKVTLEGTGSYDSDGDLLTYTWTGPFVESPAYGATPTVTLDDGCPGGHVITLVVNDGTEDSEPNDVMITVVDTTPPEFALSVNPTTLWPPSHQMVKITPTWTVSDNCDAMPGVSLVSISINESNTKGNGRTDDDVKIGDDGSIYLRAERSGKGSDRIYTITYQAVDNSGNATVRSTTVTVPHDRR